MIKVREQRLARVAEDEAAARAVIERCSEDRKRIGGELGALYQVVGLIQADLKALDAERTAPAPDTVPRPDLTLVPPSDGAADDEPRLKARIGDQRYLMLSALRIADSPSAEALASETGLNPRRVKDQMATDVENGVVAVSGERLRITPKGLDLLDRFESYKRRKGQKLPSLDDARRGDDRDEADPETTNEGDEG